LLLACAGKAKNLDGSLESSTCHTNRRGSDADGSNIIFVAIIQHLLWYCNRISVYAINVGKGHREENMIGFVTYVERRHPMSG